MALQAFHIVQACLMAILILSILKQLLSFIVSTTLHNSYDLNWRSSFKIRCSRSTSRSQSYCKYITWNL